MNAERLLLAYRQAIDKNICHSITDADGTIVYVNNKFCELSKYSPHEVIGQNHRILKSGEHGTEFYRTLWNTIKQGVCWQGEVKNKAKDNSYYWTDTVILPVADASNRVVQFLALRYPITQRKQLEQQQKEYADGLKEMLFMTSHEVRQPVAHCLGLMNVLERKNTSKEEVLKTVSYFKESAMRLDAFTKKLTAFMHNLQSRKGS